MSMKPEKTPEQLKLEEIAALKKKIRQKKKEQAERERLKIELPHLYGWKFYAWQRRFFDSRNRMNILTCGNQLGKSGIQIRKAIHWATCPELWPSLWITKPNQFFYFYPSKDLATIEVMEKWEKDFLPQGKAKDHPVYGWNAEYEKRGQRKIIHCIRFNSGVTIYFKSYAQNEMDLQAATVHAVFVDEEMPENLYPEIRARIRGTQGYFHAAFTATLGQEFWRLAVEPTPEEVEQKLEKFPTALKIQASAFDCMVYEDGSPGPWTKERIQAEIDDCQSKDEEDRRIHGKFIPDVSEKVYTGFDWARNVKAPEPIPKDWTVYAGIDIGGGGNGHPAAIVFIAVNPGFTRGRFFKGWRGDGITTSSGDVLNKYLEMKKEVQDMGFHVLAAYYDWHCKEFKILCSRVHEPIIGANKNHGTGEETLNNLLKWGMLTIDSGDPELIKLCNEMRSLKKSTPKAKAKDDFCDGARYSTSSLPWDFSSVMPSMEPVEETEKDPEDSKPAPIKRRVQTRDPLLENRDEIEDEFEDANEQYGS